jgi:hypothetical protein
VALACRYGGPMTRRLAPALVALLLLGIPSTAGADSRSKRDRGGARAGPALDIAAVTATGSANGLVVSVRMKGNFERGIGRRSLGRAGVVLILRPRSRRARPSILATTGPSTRPRNLLRTRSRRVGIARIGRTVDFVIVGAGLAGVRRLDVKTFKQLPRRRGRARASDDIRITEEQAKLLLGEDGDDEATVGPPSIGTSCRELLETVRAATEALKPFGPYLDRLRSNRAPRAEITNAENAAAAIRKLETSTLAEIGRKCGTGAEVLCSGYRHLTADKSRVSATFGFTEVFGSRMFIGNFRWEYLNPSTGQYEPVQLQVGDTTNIIVSGGGQVIRAQHDIHQAGRYRVTAIVRVTDPDNLSTTLFQQETVTEVDVLPPSAGVTGGNCPPDP